MGETNKRFYTVGIVGLGLIGGSLAKAIAANTQYRILGQDIDKTTMELALAEGTISGALEDIGQCDLLIVALFPTAALEYILQNAPNLKPGAVVMDICGVKQALVEKAGEACQAHGAHFVGCHPMAGKEKWGYKNASSTLFQKASLIITPGVSSGEAVEQVQQFAMEIGFKTTVVTTPENHDRMIGYTSQLAHVLSNAYIKNPLCMEFKGYTGGSFQDLTRVAKLNPIMWSELFLLNRDNLLREINVLIDHLAQYRDALSAGDGQLLTDLLAEGSHLKEQLLEEKGE